MVTLYKCDFTPCHLQKGRRTGEAGAASCRQPGVPPHRGPGQVRGARHLLQQPEDLHTQAEDERGGGGGGGQPRLGYTQDLLYGHLVPTWVLDKEIGQIYGHFGPTNTWTI